MQDIEDQTGLSDRSTSQVISISGENMWIAGIINQDSETKQSAVMQKTTAFQSFIDLSHATRSSGGARV